MQPSPDIEPAEGLVTDEPSGAAAHRGGTPLDDFIRAISRRWMLILLVAAAVTLLVWLAAALQPERYRAVAIAAVAPTAEQLSSTDVIRGVETLERRVIVASLAALASAPVTRRALAAGDGYDVRAAVMPNTNLFRIEVEGASAAKAAEIANRIPTLLSGQAQAMYRVYGVALMSPATAPSSPVMPRIGRAVLAGIALGLLLGLAAAYVAERKPGILTTTPWRRSAATASAPAETAAPRRRSLPTQR